MLRPSTTALLRRAVLDRQRTGRVPGVVAGVWRHGEPLWSAGVGTAEVGTDRAPTLDDQFLVASNTKTFTATMVLQLRDEGRLELTDRVADHVPGLTHDLTVRDALTHLGGLQREPVGDVWVTLDHPDEDALVRGAADAAQVLRPGDQFHYSNLAYSLLGALVGRLDGRTWTESLHARLLEPLGMTRTSVGFDGGPRAQGAFVGPWHDVPVPEPVVDLRATSPAGGIASTAADLGRWTAFVADPDPAVLDPATMDEIVRPRAFIDLEGWQLAMGFGIFVLRTPGGRTVVGHNGGLPGFVTGVYTERSSGTGVVVLTNSSTPPDPALLAADLVDLVLDRDPEEPEPWRPGTEVPEDLRPLLGRWWSEGRAWDLSVREGRLEARGAAWPAGRASWTFERVGDDAYRFTAGSERGELLTVLRDDAGAVRELRWTTYAMTRDPQPFGEPDA